MTPESVVTLIEKFGAPVAILGIILWFISKKIWPLLEKQIESQKLQLDAAHALMKETNKDFVAALERRDQMTIQEFARLHDRLARRDQ